MGKLKLDLDDLHVESFQAQPEKAERTGTVEAREITAGCYSYLFGTCPVDLTCGGTCGVTCYLSRCDQVCPQTGTAQTNA